MFAADPGDFSCCRYLLLEKDERDAIQLLAQVETFQKGDVLYRLRATLMYHTQNRGTNLTGVLTEYH